MVVCSQPQAQFPHVGRGRGIADLFPPPSTRIEQLGVAGPKGNEGSTGDIKTLEHDSRAFPIHTFGIEDKGRTVADSLMRHDGDVSLDLCGRVYVEPHEVIRVTTGNAVPEGRP